MSTQLHLARGVVEGRASMWQDLASLQNMGLSRAELRRIRRLNARR